MNIASGNAEIALVLDNTGSMANDMQALRDRFEAEMKLIAGSNATLEVWKNEASKVSAFANFGVDSFEQKNNLLAPNELIFEPRTDGLPGTSIDGEMEKLFDSFAALSEMPTGAAQRENVIIRGEGVATSDGGYSV